MGILCSRYQDILGTASDMDAGLWLQRNQSQRKMTPGPWWLLTRIGKPSKSTIHLLQTDNISCTPRFLAVEVLFVINLYLFSDSSGIAIQSSQEQATWRSSGKSPWAHRRGLTDCTTTGTTSMCSAVYTLIMVSVIVLQLRNDFRGVTSVQWFLELFI